MRACARRWPADGYRERPCRARTRARGSRRWATTSTEGGYSTLEAVLLLPLLVLFTLVVVQFALIWHARDVAEGAARQGVQAARAYTGTDAEGTRQAHDYLQAVDPDLLAGTRIDVTRTPTDVAVRLRAHVMAVPGLPFTIDLDERSTGPLERFVAGAP